MKSMNLNQLKRQWMAFAVSGLILIGSGLSVMGEALLLKYSEAPLFEWFSWGTIALVMVNSGISLFGKAVIIRTKIEFSKPGL
jgi:hypothetical protein